jgi:cellulose synthase/poly-beta-1,6-N-acetylglucosamine synthase-like glycosyltransferase
MIISIIITTLYAATLIGLAIYAFNALVMSALFIRHRHRVKHETPPPQPQEWPQVTVQLPIFNERHVIERLIDAVVSLDYPLEKLSIQILDDSDDETTTLARVRVAYHAAQGIDISYLRRPERTGYKAGALAYGLQQTNSEFIAIFDADFVPQSNFLKDVIPHFADPRIAMVQSRWGHLNAETSPFTRAQAIALDGHFAIEQTARSRSGLLLNFNGSGGIWRRAAIENAGGWQTDTIAEDLDLSYRAQLAGWKLHYLPNVIAPAEVPPTLTAYKRQQFRWAKGSVQCLRKLGRKIALHSPFTVWQKIEAFLQMSAYLVHPLMLAMILIGLPAILIRDPDTLSLGALGIVGLAPPILFALSQWNFYPDWKRRFAYFPFLMLLGAGMALNNSKAIFEATIGRNPQMFLRTPKFSAEGHRAGQVSRDYNVPVDWTTWGEIIISLYCLAEAVVAFTRAPGLAIFLIIYAIGYLYTAGLGLWQSWGRTHYVGRAEPSRSIQ